MLRKHKNKMEANNFCRGQIQGQVKTFGQAKFEAISGQTNLETRQGFDVYP